jgi:hypothetical protein
MKTGALCLVLATGWAGAGAAQQMDFGDDSSDYASDGECDDRRFAGPGMAVTLSNVNIGRDAADCRAALDGGRVVVWDFQLARAATDCNAINYGDDSSEWALDGTCDDPRFDGIGAAEDLLDTDMNRDASDCRRLCAFGAIALRRE